MMERTSIEFDEVILKCRQVFQNKLSDYGPAWRILRPPSLTDQIYIKANRIRSIDSKGIQKVDEGIIPEFIGIINYSLIALIQLNLDVADEMDIDINRALSLFDTYSEKAKGLMLNKNHDYGEAWRNMRVSSLTDIVLMKLLRIKQIEDNKGKALHSEGVDSGYFDIINYAVFALIKLIIEDDKYEEQALS